MRAWTQNEVLEWGGEALWSFQVVFFLAIKLIERDKLYFVCMYLMAPQPPEKIHKATIPF